MTNDVCNDFAIINRLSVRLMQQSQPPTVRWIERLISAAGCGLAGIVLALIAWWSVFILTEPAVDLGWVVCVFCGAVLGAVFGWFVPRVGVAIARVVFFFLQ
jgi:hypothetical protein